MIDNLEKTTHLLAWLEDVLPMPAMMTPGLAESLREKIPQIVPMQVCEIVDVHYLGEVAGIACVIEIPGASDTEVFIVSITHLRFDPRQPIAPAIKAYQKHRIKRIRRETGGSPKFVTKPFGKIAA